MTQEELIIHWKNFFKDLFLGTFTRAVSSGLLGFGLGAAFLGLFKGYFLDQIEISVWLEVPILGLAMVWYLAWGLFHSLGGATIYTIQRKVSETIGGLQSLLDLLSRQALGSIPKVHRVFTKTEISEKFEGFGKQFQANLKLKGLTGWIVSFFFGLILKVLRFMFLDEVAETVLNKPGNEITSSDIESVVRRIGVEALLSPIVDQFILIHILNFALMILTLGMPFFIFWTVV